MADGRGKIRTYMDEPPAEPTVLSEEQAISAYKAVSATASWMTGCPVGPIDLDLVVHPWMLLPKPFTAYANIAAGLRLIEPYIAPPDMSQATAVILRYVLDDSTPTDYPYVKTMGQLMRLLAYISSDERMAAIEAGKDILDVVLEHQVVEDLRYQLLVDGPLSESQVRRTFEAYKTPCGIGIFSPLPA